ncbi:hypothetical protein PIB30_023253 [Stylosanthes scabra]|uniref:Uncharacterized protein n=1 Tax=Stylosanthes scabra TaxID=79078 RepID=A0ABU6Y9G8_9FABA|nr:hypothetical protein [Stylosanthes scabra]
MKNHQGEEEPPVAPTRRLNLQYNGSELYDSFEWRQMTHQLNKAIHNLNADPTNKVIQGVSASSPAYIFNLNSPLYRHQLNFLYRESTKTPRRISGPQVPEKRACGRGTRIESFVTRFWVKVKRGLFGK